MKAAVITGVECLELREVPEPVAQPGEAVVAVRAAALNHRDVWMKSGQYAGIKYPNTPGSDGAGVVASVGEGVDPAWVGREVIIYPALDWGPNEAAQGPGFSILGLPRDGTLAERVCVPVAQLTPKPSYLDWIGAAALPLAGLTAYRALFVRAGLKPGERILISGIGSGVALFVLQYAVAVGAEVWVTSSSREKIQRAVTLGARGGFEYTGLAWAQAAARDPRLFTLVVDSAGGGGLESLIDLTAAGGRIVLFGATRGNHPGLPLRKVFWRQISILGTTMGSPSDWKAMLGFVETHKIKPVVSGVFPLGRVSEAFDLMTAGGQFGKIVVQISA